MPYSEKEKLPSPPTPSCSRRAFKIIFNCHNVPLFAFFVLGLAALSTPIIKPMSINNFQVHGTTYNGTVSVGVFGYCFQNNTESGSTTSCVSAFGNSLSGLGAVAAQLPKVQLIRYGWISNFLGILFAFVATVSSRCTCAVTYIWVIGLFALLPVIFQFGVELSISLNPNLHPNGPLILTFIALLALGVFTLRSFRVCFRPERDGGGGWSKHSFLDKADKKAKEEAEARGDDHMTLSMDSKWSGCGC